MNFATKVAQAEFGKTHLFSVGQAGFIIKSAGGQLLGIDLYLSNCVERLEGHMGYKRLIPQILMPSELEFNVVVATHPHYDHFDMDAIPELLTDRHTELYASVNCEKEMRRIQMTNERTHYVKPGEKYEAGDFRLEFVSCDHGTGAPDAVGVIVAVDGKRIFEAGDTCLRLDRVQEYLEGGAIDVLIAPINGAYGNLNERDCARLSAALQPKLTIPCHYGMFASHGGNPGAFYDIMRQEYPKQQMLLMAPGEQITLQ